MMASVAGQFHFDEPSVWGMPLSRLRYWYSIVVELNEDKT